MPNLTAAVESAVGLAVAALGCVVIGVGLAVSRDALVRDALAATRRQAVAIRLGLVLAGATPLVLVLLPVGTPAPPPSSRRSSGSRRFSRWRG